MKIQWYVILIVGIAMGFAAAYSIKKTETVIVEKTDTVETEKVTIHIVQLDPVAVDIPEPDSEEEYIPEYPDPIDYNLDKIRIYSDTSRFDGLKLGWKATVRGELKGLSFAPYFLQKTVTRTITITKTEKAKPVNGLFVGLRVGGSPTSFSTLAPSLDYVNQNLIIGYDYNIMDKGHNIKVGKKLFGFKK